MAKSKVEKPKGILNPKVGEKKFQLSRHLPAQDLSFFVERYWIVNWDLRGQEPYLSENLPYPALLDLRGLTRKNGPTPPNRAKDVETKSILS